MPSAPTDPHPAGSIRPESGWTGPSAQRRIVLRGGLSGVIAALFAPMSGCAVSAGEAVSGTASGVRPSAVAASADPQLDFRPVAATDFDGITLPEGYVAQIAFPWGDPVGIAGAMPAWKEDASNTAAEQTTQFGMHHDGMHYFPIDSSNTHGLLAINHEYTDEGLLHADGMKTWSAEKTAKSMAAVGVSVIEVVQRDGQWEAVRPSRYARRVTARTPTVLAGPAAGHALMRTAADPIGQQVLGTFANCAHGVTPWGTYLTCEENWALYFRAPATSDPHQARWGLRRGGPDIRWYLDDERFDAARHPNEFNRFGWVVEIDPFDPTMTPIKRTALGRAARECARTVQTREGRVAVYMGEDARFEYLYKFVSRDRVRPGGLAANRDLLDHGTLYVARFNDDGSGDWLPLVWGRGPLTTERGFADQGEVLIKARQASDALGGTKMDRPEWITVDPRTGEVYCSLSNNTRRGAKGQPAVDAANPRANNTMGQIIRWKEADDFDSLSFRWNHFVLAGDPGNERAEAKGSVRGDAFGSPDGLYFDSRGTLWIQTDAAASSLGKGDYARLGNNMLLAADVRTGEIRRFLVGPRHCEITGVVCTSDLRTMFVNIQHPGETPSEISDPDNPSRYSTWPSGRNGARPRSATVIVRRRDGGVIGL